MAEGPRRSSRTVKPNQNSDFVYDDEIVECIVGRNSENWQPQTISEHSDSDNSTTDKQVNNSLVQGTLTWSVLDNLPNYENLDIDSDISSTDSYSVRLANQSQVQKQNTLSAENSPVVNKVRGRRNSSTKYNFIGETFIDLQGNFLSSGSTSDIVIMSNSESDIAQAAGSKCNGCDKDSCVDCIPSGLARAVMAAVNKIDKLTERLGLLENVVILQNDRLEKQDNNSGTDCNSGTEKSKKHSSKKVSKVKNKLDRVEFEKERSLKVMMEKLESRNKNKKKSESEEESSDDEVSVKSVRKKMSRKQKMALGRKVSSRLSEAGDSFAEEDSSHSSGSGTDSSKVSCHSRKKHPKSGAKVKKRPVKRTELWPHTIANESDDEDITHDTIKLSKFLSCSTQIIIECENETEAAGRSVLLNAITSILDFQPWPEVRSFHNTVMTRIEQERIDWKADFKLLADQFVDKKVVKC